MGLHMNGDITGEMFLSVIYVYKKITFYPIKHFYRFTLRR